MAKKTAEEQEYEALIAQLKDAKQAREYIEAAFAHYETNDDLESFLAVLNAVIAGRYKNGKAPKKVLQKLGFELELKSTATRANKMTEK